MWVKRCPDITSKIFDKHFISWLLMNWWFHADVNNHASKWYSFFHILVTGPNLNKGNVFIFNRTNMASHWHQLINSCTGITINNLDCPIYEIYANKSLGQRSAQNIFINLNPWASTHGEVPQSAIQVLPHVKCWRSATCGSRLHEYNNTHKQSCTHWMLQRHTRMCTYNTLTSAHYRARQLVCECGSLSCWN